MAKSPTALIVVALTLALAALVATVSGSFNQATMTSFLQFSAAAYCPADKISVWKCSHCGSGFEIYKVLSNTNTNTQGFIGLIHAQNKIVLAFRGTKSTSITNWVTDLKASKSTNYDGVSGAKVHTGFLQAWESIRTPTVNALRTLRARYPAYKLAITGHSLGGALAVLAATDLGHHEKIVDEIYTFGAPRVGNSAFVQHFQEKVTDSFRIVNNDDVVPHVPTKSMGFLHTPSERWHHNSDTFVTCHDSVTAEDPKCSDSVLLPVSVVAHMTYVGVKLGWGDC